MYEKRLTTTPRGGEFGIRSIYESRAGEYWVSNTRQRFEFPAEIRAKSQAKSQAKSPRGALQYEAKEGLPSAATDDAENFTYIPSITEDKEGALWMACGSDGVWSFDGTALRKLGLAPGAYALSALCDRTGKIWVGTLEDGVFCYEGQKFERFHVPEDEN